MTRRFNDYYEAGVDIATTGSKFELDISDAPQVGLQLTATAEADYAFDVSPDGSAWFPAVTTYEAANMDTTRIDDGWTLPEAWVRLRVTAAAASGNTADIYLAATRG